MRTLAACSADLAGGQLRHGRNPLASVMMLRGFVARWGGVDRHDPRW